MNEPLAFCMPLHALPFRIHKSIYMDDEDSRGIRAYVARRKRRKTADPAPDRHEEGAAEPPEASEEPLAPPAPASSLDELLPPLPPGPPPPIDERREEEAQEERWARLERGIRIDGGDVPPAVHSFQAMALPPTVLQTLDARGLRAPTEIQAQVIPSILKGRDVIALAATGSGKTLAYLLPLLVMASKRPYPAHWQPSMHASVMIASPYALVIVPTRELMDQVLHELLSFPLLHTPQHYPYPSQDSGLRPLSVAGICGGISLQHQIAWLQSQANELAALVATPGRLLHLLGMKTPPVLTLQNVSYLVIDEVDRLLETELEQQLRQILLVCNNDSKRQTLLFSATMPHFLDRIARSAVINPVIIRVGMGSSGSGTVAINPSSRWNSSDIEGVTQQVMFMRFAEKKSKLLEVLRTIPRPPVLVFCNSHESVEFVTRTLQGEQFHVASLHGEQSQAYRFQALEAFRGGFVDILVATDLVSRGLDFQDVDHVIIFDMPHTIEDYVHRCGRTGRRREVGIDGRESRIGGTVTAFLTIECAIASELQQMLKESGQSFPRELELPSRFQQPTHK